MDIDVYSPAELPTVFRVLRTALSPSGPLDSTEKLFLDTYARITEYDLAAGDLQPIDPRDVRLYGAHQRKRLIQLSAIAVLLSNPVKPEALRFLQLLAKQLATHDSIIDVIVALREGKRFKVRVLAMRRAFRVIFKEAYLAEGVMGIFRVQAAMIFKARVNKDKLWNYKRLGVLPEGTLGREYFKQMVNNGFGFPGEPGGIPETVAYHDVGHVIADHAATPLGEIQQGSFQGGNRREDGFLFIQFVILQFHHGVKITPATDPQVGNFDPELVLWAIHRGAKCNVDITHQWNFWPLMSLTLQEARDRIELLPRLQSSAVNSASVVLRAVNS